MTNPTSKGAAKARRKKPELHHDVSNVGLGGQGWHPTGVEEQIRQVGELYRMITGSEPAAPEKPIAPIPPEVNPESYVQENLAKLMGRLQGFGAPDYVTATATAAAGQPAPPTGPLVAPLINVWETDEEWICECDIPGADRDDVNIAIENGYLHVLAARHSKGIKENWRCIYGETAPGRYERWIPLPSHLNGQKASAHYENGRLFIEVPKAEPSAEYRVKVEVG